MSLADRYSRQIRFPPLGEKGQERLRRSSVLLVGIGALGSSLAETLVRAGVGRMWLVDRDVVEASNLQRQQLYTEADVARPKAVAATDHLARINHEVHLTPLAEDFGPRVYAELDGRPDLILDGTDNFATRYLLNDLALRDGLPWIYGGVVGSRGTAMAILPGLTPCLRCLMPEPPATGESETCETAGVIAPAVASVTAFQAAEAMKILTGHVDAVTRGILMLDVWRHEHTVRMAAATPSESCMTCLGREFPALERDWSDAVSFCGRDAVQVQPRGTSQLDLARLATRLEGTAADLELTAHLLRFRVDDCRFSVFAGGRAILFGLQDTDRARVLYDRYVGA
jgi:molybdopterin-synthase adenylyltransferase